MTVTTKPLNTHIEGVTIVQTKEGTPREVGSIRSRRLVVINRVWDVIFGGEVIGHIEYRMFTRERRTPGKRYVNARWEVPGWEVRAVGQNYSRQEESSRKRAVDQVYRMFQQKRGAARS